MSALCLRIIASCCMLLDHIGYLFPALAPLRWIGRLAFPLYAFLLVNGFCVVLFPGVGAIGFEVKTPDKRGPQPPQVEKPRAYLFRMARNLVVDTLRKNQPTENLGEHEHLGITYDSDMKLDLEQAFSMLTLQERQLAALHLSAGLTFREVAAIVERPLGTVLWQYQKAIGKLRMILDGGCL